MPLVYEGEETLVDEGVCTSISSFASPTPRWRQHPDAEAQAQADELVQHKLHCSWCRGCTMHEPVDGATNRTRDGGVFSCANCSRPTQLCHSCRHAMAKHSAMRRGPLARCSLCRGKFAAWSTQDSISTVVAVPTLSAGSGRLLGRTASPHSPVGTPRRLRTTESQVRRDQRGASGVSISKDRRAHQYEGHHLRPNGVRISLQVHGTPDSQSRHDHFESAVSLLDGLLGTVALCTQQERELVSKLPKVKFVNYGNSGDGATSKSETAVSSDAALDICEEAAESLCSLRELVLRIEQVKNT